MLTAGPVVRQSLGPPFIAASLVGPAVRAWSWLGAARTTWLLGLGLSLALAASATAIGIIVRPHTALTVITLLYLTSVLIAAAQFGLMPALLAALVSVLALDFLFIEPLYSFEIADLARDGLTLGFFAFAAVITSGLASRLRGHMLLARHHAAIAAELYAFGRILTQVVGLEPLLAVIVGRLTGMLPVTALILLAENGRLVRRAASPGDAPIGEETLLAIDRSWRQGRAAGQGTDILGGSPSLFLPLQAATGPVGVLVATPLRPEVPLTADQRRLLDATTELAGIAIERQRLADDIERLHIGREVDQFRSALLSSVAHDLREPVAAVVSALSGLRSDYARLDEPARHELIQAASEDAARLDRFVGNLLDIARLDAGLLGVRRDPVDIGELVGNALAHARAVLGSRRTVTLIPPDLPAVRGDFVLLEQVLFNLLDNAAKYTPEDATVTIAAARAEAAIVLRVADDGPGIPAADLEGIFDKFYRSASVGAIAGTGLGLAICRGFVEAHGGTISAANRTDRRGAVFVITLPLT